MRSGAIISHLAAFVVGACCAAIVVDGALVDAVPDRSRRSHERYRTLDAYAQALSYILNQHVDPVDERKLIYASVRGMVGELDQHSSFLPPRRYRRLRQDTEGEFAGVGITLGQGARPALPPVVESVVARSPAARAGVAVGDEVLAIGGKATRTPGKKRRSPRALHSKLRGRAGSRVVLSVRRPGAAKRAVTLVREQVKIPTVSWDWFEPGLGYIEVKKFQEATSADVRAALAGVAGHSRNGKLRGLVLDLRGNPGGLLDQGIRVADLFLSKGIIVSVGGRKGRSVEREKAHVRGTWAGFPMIVLVDQGSASAAEIVAGALQDHARAVILGLPTYGKGSVQTFLDLADGSGLKLTTARYYTPSGKSLEGTGIKPDIRVEAFEGDDIVVGNPGAPATDPAASRARKRTRIRKIVRELDDDLQLRTAYQMLRARAGSKP